MHTPDFVEVCRVAELAALRMAALAVLGRASADDAQVQGLRVQVEADGYGQPFVSVDLLGAADMPVGGFSL